MTNGFIDEVPVDHVRQWELGFHDYLASSAPQVLEGIRTEKQLTDEIKSGLEAAIKTWNETFAAEHAGAPA